MRKIFSLLLSACMLSIFASSALAAPQVIKVGHVLNTDHSWHVCLLGFAKDVKDQTKGRIDIQIFPSSQLGSEKDMVEGLRMSTIDAGLIGGSSFQNLDAKFGIEELPYAFSSHEAAYKVFDGAVGNALFKILDDKGIKGLAWWENGFRHISNNKGPINTPADLKGVKIRVTPNKMRLDTFKELGASPMPIAFGELYSALQQGVVDAQENPLAIFYSSAFFEVQKYLSLTQHIWGSALLSINERIWNKLSKEDQEIIQKAAYVWRDKQRAMVQEANKDWVSKIEAKGVSVNTVDTKPFRDAVAGVWKSFEPVFGKELMDQMR